MTLRLLSALAALALLSACGGATGPSPEARQAPLETGPFKMLVFSRTAGFRHASIEPGIAALRELGAANAFTVDATEDPAAFTNETCASTA